MEREGVFDVAVNKVLPEVRLKPETVFKCLLNIPGTDFSIKEETLYFPGKGESLSLFMLEIEKLYASSGNRTRAARVAGEHSTTEPTMLVLLDQFYCIYIL